MSDTKEKKARTPSAATLRTRAFGRIQKIEAKIDAANAAADRAVDKHRAEKQKMLAELAEAEAEFDALSGKTTATFSTTGEADE